MRPRKLEEGIYHDNADGVVKPIGHALRTASEIAAEAPAAAPPPPLPPLIALVTVQPLSERVTEMHRCGWSTPGQPFHRAKLEADAWLADNRIDAPNIVAIIDADQAEANRLLIHAASLNAKTAWTREALKILFLQRGETLLAISEQSSQLKAIEAELDAPASMHLEEGRLLKLTHQRRHAPAIVAELQANADAMATEIKATLKASGIDGKGLLARMDKQNGPGTHLHRLFDAQVMVLP